MNTLTRRYYPLLGPNEIAVQDASILHESKMGYRIAFFSGEIHRYTLLVNAKMGVTLRLADPDGRLRWVLVWAPVGSPDSPSVNILSSVGCFCYKASNLSKECDFKSNVYNSELGKRFIHFFDMETARLEMREVESAPVYTLPPPGFGVYSPYLEFAYSELEEAAQDWPDSFPESGKIPPCNIDIAKTLTGE